MTHKRLFIPGPVEVRPEILQAQTQWIIGHRSPEIVDLISSLQPKLQQVFKTKNRVYLLGCSGTGFWEAASRNCIREGRKVLHLTGGAFSERWADVSAANGKQVDTLQVEWGRAHIAGMVAQALEKQAYDAVCVVHNETSTGVTNPLKEIGEVIAQYDDTLYLVDTVSGLVGAELRVDEWGIDVALTSSQKALSLPPGIAFATVSNRVLERAKQIEHRGYYFDFLSMEKSLKKNNTPSTPPVSLMFAADQQLDDLLEKGIEYHWERHARMRDITHQWVQDRGFGFFAQDGYRSPTVTTVDNRQKKIDVMAMAKFMYEEKHYIIDKGYGKIKGETFRIAHMGDMTVDMLEDVLSGFDEFLS